jgi:uncharacterized phosphosugar-binding protein
MTTREGQVPVRQGGMGSGWLTERTTELLAAVARANAAPLERAIKALVDTIRIDGMIHVGATGHGTALVLETFYRAGGLACIDPIWDPALLTLNGARRTTAEERVPGFGSFLADRAGVSPGDSVVVFSQSGVNPVPIDLAARARALGATTVASRDPQGRRLPDVADVVIDTDVPPGDAVYPLGEGQPRIAAFSTIVGAHAWNLLLIGVLERVRAEGLAIPVWVSSNVAGGDERNAELIAQYGTRVPSL